MTTTGFNVYPIRANAKPGPPGSYIYSHFSPNNSLETEQQVLWYRISIPSTSACDNASPDGSKFMLLCETAVGKAYKLTHAQYMDEPPEGYDSTQVIGQHGPCYSKCFTFPEGFKIPKGKYLEYEYEDRIKRDVYLRHNEFIIYNNNGH